MSIYWALALLGGLALVSGWLVFRFDSMVRATLSLMVSFLAVACLMLWLNSEFLFAITFLMMIGEMMIMVLFMLAFMMNPAGLNPMNMIHQPRIAALAGAGFFGLAALTIAVADLPPPQGRAPAEVTAAIGHQLLGPSMLVFEVAGMTLLVGMIAVAALTARRGRFGDAIRVQREQGQGGGHHHHHHGGHG